ncbi:protein NYNRIN-like [Jatropha curcas]|uniref:protein NYNRIN-like n=1 Tax=Jatropha curcas TaxID=180498 RepID=UPI0018945F76|nr:protein NYNRIN-like [Jatropha curcas]
MPCYEEHFVNQVESEEEPWFMDILLYMKDGTFSDDATKEDRLVLRKMALKYVLADGELYRKAWNGMLLRCVDKKEGVEIMKKIHEGVCGTHLSGMSLAQKIMRQGHFWVQMEAWGIDIIGKITPATSNGYQYILVAVDYFSKWIEAQSYKTLTAKQVARFIEQNIFCRYGIPHHVVTDNGSHFQADVGQLLYKYKVEHHHSSPYRPQANGTVEAANKEIKKILSKMCEKYRSWAEKLPFVLWGHRTTFKSVNGASPFELVYGMEAVLPVELEKKSLRVLVEAGLIEEEWVKKRYGSRKFQDQKMRKRRIAAFYNKAGYSKGFEKGHLDLVLVRLLDHEAQSHPGGKFRPNWHGPFRIQKLLVKGAAELVTMEGKPFNRIVNQDQMKRFYV